MQAGSHVAISPGAVPRFLKRFEETYSALGKAEAIISAAAAHHRLLWMHPFLDGNGRVARLMSHATLLNTLDTGAVWSVARGLARSVNGYKGLLANCDQSRWNDRDGCGALSEEALAGFTRFFLTVCIDQVAFMESLVQPDRLRAASCCGRKRKFGLASCLPNRAVFWKPSSIVADSRAGMQAQLPARENARHADCLIAGGQRRDGVR